MKTKTIVAFFLLCIYSPNVFAVSSEQAGFARALNKASDRFKERREAELQKERDEELYNLQKQIALMQIEKLKNQESATNYDNASFQNSMDEMQEIADRTGEFERKQIEDRENEEKIAAEENYKQEQLRLMREQTEALQSIADDRRF